MVNAPEVVAIENQESESKIEVPAVEGKTNGDSETKKSIEAINVETATELLNKGKRDLFCDNITQAVSSLSESCAQFDKVYGEGDIKCAKSYFWYGNALLELARIENGVLGNALQGIPNEDKSTEEKNGDGVDVNGEGEGDEVVVEDPDKLTDEEKETVREQVVEAMEEAAAASQQKEGETEDEDNKENGLEDDENDKNVTNEDVEDDAAEEVDNANGLVDETEAEESEKEKEDGTEESDGNAGAGASADDEAVEEGGEDEGEEEEEDDDSLKLSWQMLDWARKLLESTTDTEVEGRLDLLAQCFLKLGENLMESAHHSDADIEFKKCIDVYQATLASGPLKDSDNSNFERSLAEAYFMAGINLLNAENFTNAVNYFENAVSVFRRRMASIQSKLNSLPEGSDSQKEKLSSEMKELGELLPNMQDRLHDAKMCSDRAAVLSEGVVEESKEKTSALQQAFREVEMKECSLNNSEKSDLMESAPVKDINHLVKRKSPLKEKVVSNQEDDNVKRKAEKNLESEENASKKVKLDEDSKVGGTNNTNGTTVAAV